MKERINELNVLISALCKELDELPASKSQLLIDNDEEYQDQLEIGWLRDDLWNKLRILEFERLALWQEEKNEYELNSLENQSTES